MLTSWRHSRLRFTRSSTILRKSCRQDHLLYLFIFFSINLVKRKNPLVATSLHSQQAMTRYTTNNFSTPIWSTPPPPFPPLSVLGSGMSSLNKSRLACQKLNRGWKSLFPECLALCLHTGSNKPPHIKPLVRRLTENADCLVSNIPKCHLMQMCWSSRPSSRNAVSPLELGSAACWAL